MRIHLALLVILVAGCTDPRSTEPPTAVVPTHIVTPAPTPTPTPRSGLSALPTGRPPRIGYVDHGDYVSPSGRRTELPRELVRAGISAITPYDGGFLVSDARYFEGSVGLWFVRDGRARELPGCSAGSPRRVDGWVWWITAGCPESLDHRRARIHRARPDGSRHHVRLLRGIDENALFRAARILDRLAPAPRQVPEDGRHRLAVVVRGRFIAIVRIGPGGSRELATPIARFGGRRPAYALGPGR